MKKLIPLLFITIITMSFAFQRKQHVIFFGDSITQMGVEKGGYIWQMQEMLKAKKLDDQFRLTGAGIGGNKIYDLYLRMPEDVLDKKPDIVFIYVGVNDVWHKTTHGTGTDLDKFEKFYDAVIRKLMEENIQAILVTPAGIGELKNNANPQDKDLDTYSDVIRKLSERYKLRLVDLRNLWKTYNAQYNTENKESGILSTDRVHLNDNGNKAVAEAMLKALNINL
jgi:lysophospholipase L1-like esterase